MGVYKVKRAAIYSLLVLLTLAFMNFSFIKLERAKTITVFAMPVNKKVIVLDAGHGGWDPGKTVGKGKSMVVEKDINLQIVEKLRTLLEFGGAVVFTTRAEDVALAKTKDADLTARVRLANAVKADLFVSIHQNSFPSASVSGTQIFYYSGSPEGKRLAEITQAKVKTHLNPKNRFIAKPNSEYFMLKRSTSPAILAECGFLTNYAELKLLTDGAYQDKIAWTLYLSILEYFSPIDEGEIK